MIHIIAAMTAKNRVIGINNTLPWHYKEDLKHFKELTTENVIIMGRKTFESIGKPLPNRINVVISRDISYRADGCEVYSSIEEAIKDSQKHNKEIFIIGWWEIYRQSLGFANILDITLIRQEYDGDTFFPSYTHDFKEIDREELGEFDFVTYKKK
ncbi:MAG: hypothetical protein ACD_71C00085G0001 [uncultured bacterium (gcode 4)]|uniref:Dihydrofolate reductase n=1 Tax=uncultured bacterium (gcode 4) TaxID=1234023 RepID=K1Z520_9BACT|nr:MAG: hypothetical protein ACD_71C00085G0001 [uncultured bacterium (gcode 4)]